MDVKKKYGDNATLIWKDRKRFMGMPLSFTRYYLIKNGDVWFKAFRDVGLFSTHIEEVNLYRMYDISLYQSFADKIFGTGTVVLYSNDERQPQLVLKNIKQPFKVRDLFSQLIEEERKANGVKVAEIQA